MYEIMTQREIAELQELASKTLKESPLDREQIKQDLKEKIKRLEVR